MGDARLGAEVGVFAGDLSKCLLEIMPELHLYMIDAWREEPRGTPYSNSIDPHAACTGAEHEEYFREACEKAQPFGRRATVFRQASPGAAENFPNHYFDFVFLDADHTEDAVRRDIAAWRSKVKKGGVLCGHDYANGGFDGVKIAVDEAFGHNVVLGRDNTWFVRL